MNKIVSRKRFTTATIHKWWWRPYEWFKGAIKLPQKLWDWTGQMSRKLCGKLTDKKPISTVILVVMFIMTYVFFLTVNAMAVKFYNSHDWRREVSDKVSEIVEKKPETVSPETLPIPKEPKIEKQVFDNTGFTEIVLLPGKPYEALMPNGVCITARGESSGFDTGVEWRGTTKIRWFITKPGVSQAVLYIRYRQC